MSVSLAAREMLAFTAARGSTPMSLTRGAVNALLGRAASGDPIHVHRATRRQVSSVRVKEVSSVLFVVQGRRPRVMHAFLAYLVSTLSEALISVVRARLDRTVALERRVV